MNEYNILAVGEVLYDVIYGQHKLGGAPFNVAAHMAKLGNRSYILSAVGRDDLGDRILKQADELNVSTPFIFRSNIKPTGTVRVEFHGGEPDYEITEDVAWDFLQADLEEIKQLDWAVVAFGSLAQRSKHNQEFYNSLFDHLRADWIYFDCNLRQAYFSKKILEESLKFANIAKFNEFEIQVASELLFEQDLKPDAFGRKLHADYNIELVVYTWGKAGSGAWYRGKMSNVPSNLVQTKDTVGAGDAFSAGFLHSWIHGKNVHEALQQGNRLGGYVASHAGAIPEYDAEIIEYFR